MPTKTLQPFRFSLSPKEGFTLIELLVVMTVIGILATLSINTYVNVQKRGRDAKRQSDFHTIQLALEAYKADVGHYPITTAWVNSSAGGYWIPGLDQKYIKDMPQDPLDATNGCPSGADPRDTTCHTYAYNGSGWGGPGTPGATYLLGTILEGTTNVQNARVQNPAYGSISEFPQIYGSPPPGFYGIGGP